MPPRISIIIPCYNEEEAFSFCRRAIGEVLAGLIRKGKVGADSKIVFVNDGSKDKTWELIEAACREDSLFAGICLSRNFGHQYAVLAGLQAAPGDALISIDADLQDDVSVIETMVNHFINGSDVVYGVREDRSMDTAFKRFTALAFYRLMQGLGAKSVFNHADYRLMSRRAVEALSEFHESALYLRGLMPLIGFTQSTVSYKRAVRVAGETKYPLSKMIALSLNAITSLSSYPLRLITLTAIIGVVVSLMLACYVLAVRLSLPTQAVPGWASVVLPVLFIGSLNLLASGVIGEYVARVFDEVKSRPRYFISFKHNLD